MDFHLPFVFRNKSSGCIVYIDNSSIPCYVFVDLKDQQLIHEFGKEITIKTDFDVRLSKRDDYPALIELREAILNALKHFPQFYI